MVSSSLSPENQQRVAILLPIVVVIAAIFLCYPAFANYRTTLATLSARRAEYERLRSEPLPPTPAGTAAAADLPSEPALFKQQVSAIAAASRCRVVGFDLVPMVAAVPAAKDAKPETAVIKPRRATVTITGAYPAMRSFLYRLAGANRVYVVVGIEVTSHPGTPTAPQQGLQAAVTIERYVVPLAAAAAQAAAH